VSQQLSRIDGIGSRAIIPNELMASKAKFLPRPIGLRTPFGGLPLSRVTTSDPSRPPSCYTRTKFTLPETARGKNGSTYETKRLSRPHR
jgi:hypothetical protein